MALSADGTRIVLGDASYDSENGRVLALDFHQTENDWKLVGNGTTLSQPHGSENGDLFGHDVCLSADDTRLGVSSIQSYANTGKIVLFDYYQDQETTSWQPMGNDIKGNDNQGQFGNGIAISGNGQYVSIVESNASASSGSGSIFRYISELQNWNQNISEVNVSNICFLGTTMIACDQGHIPIAFSEGALRTFIIL